MEEIAVGCVGGEDTPFIERWVGLADDGLEGDDVGGTKERGTEAGKVRWARRHEPRE